MTEEREHPPTAFARAWRRLGAPFVFASLGDEELKALYHAARAEMDERRERRRKEKRRASRQRYREREAGRKLQALMTEPEQQCQHFKNDACEVCRPVHPDEIT